MRRRVCRCSWPYLGGIVVLMLLGFPASPGATGACAHRGDVARAPENTLAAIRSAIEGGAQQVEFDVQFTSDRALVIMHDDTVDRTTDGSGRVSDLTRAELRALDAGSWYHESFRGTTIPLLAEVLAIVPPQVLCNVHIKGDVELAQAVARVIASTGTIDRCFLTLGGPGALEACAAARAAVGDIMLCLGHPAASPVNDDTARIPPHLLEPYRLSDGVVPFRATMDFVQLYHWEEEPPVDMVAESVRLLHQRGIRVNYCCADREEKIVSLADAGVDFILTDDVAACRNALGGK